MQDPVYIFFHVAKTGGVTFASIYKRNTKHTRHFKAHHGGHNMFGTWYLADIENAWKDIPEQEKEEVTWTGGHVPYGVHKIFNRPTYYVGFVRNPVDHWLSVKYYNFSIGRMQDEANLPLEALVDDLEGSLWANMQVRHYSGASDDEVITRKHLEAAKRHVDKHFLFVSPMERFDEGVVLAQHYFGWSLFCSLYKKKNVTKKDIRRDEVSAELRDKIELCQKIDMEFYQYCCREFSQSIASMGFKHKIILFAYKNANRLQQLLALDQS